ncbi:extracellular solute-binding protein [Pseudochelatococcus sp. B33]
MMHVNRRSILYGMAGLLGYGAAITKSHSRDTLVIPTYGGRWEKFWRDVLVPGLREKADIEPTIMTGLSKTFATTVRAAGGNSPLTVFMANENYAHLLRSEGIFEPIPVEKVPNLERVYPFVKNKDNNGVRAIISPIGLAYRTDLVKTPPTAWADLWDNPEFKGKIGLYQIGATAGMLFLALTAKIFGSSETDMDVAFAQVRKLLPFQQADFSGTNSTLLARGDVNVAMLDFPEVVALKQRGVPVELVVPTEGVVAFDQSFNIVKGGAEKEAAYRYINYILDPEVQTQMAREFYTAPTNMDSVVPADLSAEIPISGERMSEINWFNWDVINPMMPEILDRWNREVR